MTFSATANLKDNIKTKWDKFQAGRQDIVTKHRMKREHNTKESTNRCTSHFSPSYLWKIYFT